MCRKGINPAPGRSSFYLDLIFRFEPGNNCLEFAVVNKNKVINQSNNKCAAKCVGYFGPYFLTRHNLKPDK